MFGRLLNFIILAALLVGGPYVAMETQLGKTIVARAQSILAGDGGDSSTVLANNVHFQTESLWDQPEKHPHHDLDWMRSPSQALAGGPFRDFREIFRFDATPAWVTSQFSRVTTVLADPNMEGLRVPVVTGARPDDLAGTITYYFTDQHQLQRITFNGFTGDATRLVSLILAHYHFRADHSMGAGGYSYGWNGSPSSIMKITPTPVVYSESPNSRFTVFLEINQPNSPHGSSYAAHEVYANARGATQESWPPL